MVAGGQRPIERLVDNILMTRFEDIDPITIQQAKTRVIDTVGCLIGGCVDPGNKELVDLIARRGGAPEATIFVYGQKVPVGSAAMVNCIMCRSFDFEPVSPVVDGHLTPAHISGTTIMTAINLVEHLGLGGKELLTALLVGEDLTARILATSGFSINSGWDGNGTANAFGAAAIAGKLLGLNHRQLKNALGIVLSQMGGSMQNIWDGTPAFKLPQGKSAENGIFSAQLAAAGWTGPDDALLSPNGYYALFTHGLDRGEILTKELGNVFYADRAIKPYPSCRATHNLIECAVNMVRKHRFQADDILKVELYLPEQACKNFCGKPLNDSEFPHAETAFSYTYTAATALRYGCVKPEHFASSVILAEDTKAFVNRVSLFPQTDPDSDQSKIKVVLKRGGEVSMLCPVSNKGDFIINPLSEDELFTKYMSNVEYSNQIGRGQAERVLETINKLEYLENLDELINNLIAKE